MLKTAGRLVGLWFAYIVLFLAGAAVLGPGGGGDLSAAEQRNAMPMIGLVAGIDTGLLVAWLIRARDRGLWLWLEAFVVFYGIKTFSSNLEVWYFVKAAHVPPEMLPSLLVMTLPVAIGWTGLAVWAFGPRAPAPPPTETPRRGLDLAWRVGAAGAIGYPVLFFLAGYYIAWQSSAVRAYYEGPAVALPFLRHFGAMLSDDPWVLPFEMFRGLLWVAIGWAVLRRTRGPWWVGGILFATLLAVMQNDVHLFPNPLMPREVRVWHLIETASSDFVFGFGTAALLAPRGGWSALWEAARPGAWNRPLDRHHARVAVPLELFLAIGGLYGGALLFFDPTGGLLQLDPAFLRTTPFPDYEVPAVVLFLANGVLPLAALIALALRHHRAPRWVAASGAVLTGWMVIQIGWMGLVFWLQGALLALGLALLAVGAGWIVADRKARGA